MKKTTKLFLALLLMVMAGQANAQLKFGVKGGLNLTNYGYNFAAANGEPNTKLKPGFHIGGIVNYGISDALGIEAGLILSTRGANADLEKGLGAGETVTGYDRISTTYLMLPVHVTYTINKIQISTGPYIGFGLAGKQKYDYTIKEGADLDVNKGEETIKFMNKVGPNDLKNNEVPMSALDIGWDIGVGYMISDQIRINAEYSFGFSNLLPEFTEVPDFNSADFTYKNRAITVGVSYFFGG